MAFLTLWISSGQPRSIKVINTASNESVWVVGGNHAVPDPDDQPVGAEDRDGSDMKDCKLDINEFSHLS